MTIAELIKDLTEYAEDSEKGFDTEVRSYVGMSRQELKALPPVTPQKYGHWIWNFDKGYCKCSECGIGMGHKEFDYCPNCGCRMVEPQESEDN